MNLADVNECELMIAVCGTALCENVEGAFLCLCPSDHEEYDTETGECRPRSGIGKSLVNNILQMEIGDRILASSSYWSG